MGKMVKLNKETMEPGCEFTKKYLKENGQKKVSDIDLNTWEQVRVPNINLLAEYINKAKGNNRTMAEFAVACNVSPSTLSRIVNKFNKRPLTEELLEKIAENADDNSGVTLELLKLANGMRMKGFQGISVSHQESFYTFQETENAVRRTLTEELLQRGAKLSVSAGPNNRGIVTKGNSGYIVGWDFAFDTDLFAGYDTIYCDVIPLPLGYNSEEGDSNSKGIKKLVIQRIMDRLAKLFVLDQWQPDLFKGKKLLIALLDTEAYREITTRLQHTCVNNSITIELFSEDGEELLDEYQIPSNVAPASKRLLDIPKISTGDTAATNENLYDTLLDVDD